MPRKDRPVGDIRQVVKDRWGVLGSREKRGNVSFASADAELLQNAVDAVVEAGAALLLSRTSDGGALVLQVWATEARYKLYPATVTELDEALKLIEITGKA